MALLAMTPIYGYEGDDNYTVKLVMILLMAGMAKTGFTVVQGMTRSLQAGLVLTGWISGIVQLLLLLIWVQGQPQGLTSVRILLQKLKE